MATVSVVSHNLLKAMSHDTDRYLQPYIQLNLLLFCLDTREVTTHNSSDGVVPKPQRTAVTYLTCVDYTGLSSKNHEQEPLGEMSALVWHVFSKVISVVTVGRNGCLFNVTIRSSLTLFSLMNLNVSHSSWPRHMG